jgi:hypothetical protein
VSTGAILVSTLVIWAAVWLFVEYRTLKDNIPNNHITAVVRAAFKKEPGPFFLFALALGFLLGHLFWP